MGAGRRSGRPAPLAAEYREQPLWWDDAVFPTPSPGPLPEDVDAVVVGAGYTGTAAALELCKGGRDVLVLDKATLGRGASGRNAGMVHAGLRHNLATLERRHGALGRALDEVSRDAHRFVARMAAEVAADAVYSAAGWLHLAHRPSRLRALREGESARRRAGERTSVLDAAELQSETQCRGLHGGLLTDNGAGIHPARYLAGMQRAAMEAGVRLVEHVAVTGVERSGAGFTVRTAGCEVRARDVLLATNGYTDAAFPAVRRRVIPIGSYIIATEPLEITLAASVSPHRRMMSDTRNFLHYWRLSPDSRLVFGGRTSFVPISLQRARDQLYAAMVGMYPQLEGVRVSHAWTGNVGFTFDRLPHMGRVGGIAYAMGYCGSGVALASWLGTLAARWMDSGERNAFLELRFPTLPGYTGVPWFLPAAGWYYQLRDAVG
jgi:glycine/D-amino acid oxidase-like deaminating enzyme